MGGPAGLVGSPTLHRESDSVAGSTAVGGVARQRIRVATATPMSLEPRYTTGNVTPQYRRERSEVTRSGTEPFNTVWLVPSAATTVEGRLHTRRSPEDASTVAALRRVVRALDPMVPVESNSDATMGQMNVLPRTRRRFRTPFVPHTTRAPTPAAYTPDPAAPIVDAVPSVQTPVRLPSVSSMMSPVLGTVICSPLGISPEMEVKKVVM